MDIKHDTTKWWGWGTTTISFGLKDNPKLLPFLEQHIGRCQPPSPLQWSIDGITIPDTRLSSQQIKEIQDKLGQDVVSVHPKDRVVHAVGKSYKDMLRLRSQQLNEAPDCVFFPKSEAHVVAIVRWCEANAMALVPFGGGTSVVDGVAPKEGHLQYVGTLNLTRLNRILDIDTLSQTATVQAGILGPDLERQLNNRGFLLGHFPQSFEHSTLGGWIATLSSGQNSILYGGIENMIVSLKVLTPTGELQTLTCPRSADGPDIKTLFLGSEGVLGIILSATIRIHPIPQKQYYYSLAFRCFDEAVSAGRILVQHPFKLAMIRISDEDETQAMLRTGQPHHRWLTTVASTVAKRYIQLKGIDPHRMAIMLVGIEGDSCFVRQQRRFVKRALSNFSYVSLGQTPGQRFLKTRFLLPYLRDDLLDRCILVDTLETATSWSNLKHLYQTVRHTILESCGTQAHPGLVLTHVSHLYRDGASLYFSFFARQNTQQAMNQWSTIKTAASKAIVAAGGTISHHHGVGLDHKPYAVRPPNAHQILRNVKHTLDPNGVLNPEKLI